MLNQKCSATVLRHLLSQAPCKATVVEFVPNWFVAWFSLDQRRIEAGRDGSLICFTHKNFQPNKFSQKNILQSFFKKVASLVIRGPVKVLIIFLSAALLGVSSCRAIREWL